MVRLAVESKNPAAPSKPGRRSGQSHRPNGIWKGDASWRSQGTCLCRCSWSTPSDMLGGPHLQPLSRNPVRSTGPVKSSAKESNALCLFKNCDRHNRLHMEVLSFPDGLTMDIKREVSAIRSPSIHPLPDKVRGGRGRKSQNVVLGAAGTSLTSSRTSPRVCGPSRRSCMACWLVSREALRQEDAQDMHFEVLDVTPPRGATQITPTACLVPPLRRVPTASPGSWSPVFCGDPVSGATVQWHPWYPLVQKRGRIFQQPQVACTPIFVMKACQHPLASPPTWGPTEVGGQSFPRVCVTTFSPVQRSVCRHQRPSQVAVATCKRRGLKEGMAATQLPGQFLAWHKLSHDCPQRPGGISQDTARTSRGRDALLMGFRCTLGVNLSTLKLDGLSSDV